jgi:hypothetical protein
LPLCGVGVPQPFGAQLNVQPHFFFQLALELLSPKYEL